MMNNNFPPQRGPSQAFVARVAASELWSFVTSLPDHNYLPRRVVEAMVVHSHFDSDEVSRSLSESPDVIVDAMKDLFKSLLRWERGGRAGHPLLTTPPQAVRLYLIEDLKLLLYANIGDEEARRIDAEVVPTFSLEREEDDNQNVVVPILRSKPRPSWVVTSQSSTAFRLAADAARSVTQPPSSSKGEICPPGFDPFPWQVRYGDWSLRFLTDRKHIHIAGLPAQGVTGLRLLGATYDLTWLPEHQMHKVHGLSRAQLRAAAEGQVDDSDFDLLGPFSGEIS